MPKTFFDDINATTIAAYWNVKSNETAPYLWDTLFPTQKQVAPDFSFFRGVQNATTPLKPSAFDAQAIMRGRQGLGKVSDKTRYFKEGKYIDEEYRQQLLRLGVNGDPTERDLINNYIMDDATQLIASAELTREIMRNQLVQTGKVNVFGNGQTITADYQMKASHLAKAAKAWGADGSTVFEDIDNAKDIVGTDSDKTITRAVMNQATFRSMLKDPSIKGTMFYDNGKLGNVSLPSSELLSYLQSEYGLTVQVYDKRYVDIDGTQKKWIPDGRVIFLPEGDLGRTIMSTTPEEADLIGATGADVSIVDNGVAVSTTLQSDPVNKKVNVSQMVMPTFEQIDGVYVLDVNDPKA